MKKNPLILWLFLCVIGQLLIGARNDFNLMGHLSSISQIIIASVYINIILIPVAFIAFFILKGILKVIGKSGLLIGENAIRNIFLIWLVLFLLLFLYPLIH